MARGRKPTPTGILKMRGSWVAKTRTNEPQPETSLGRPQILVGEAAECWDELERSIGPIGLMTDADRKSLTRYCRLWSRWCWLMSCVEANREAGEGGDETDEVSRRFADMLRVGDLLLKIEDRFGLNPVARVKLSQGVKARKTNEQEQKTRFFAG